MARFYGEYLYEKTLDLFIARAGNRLTPKAELEHIRGLWRKQYYDAKDTQPFFQQIQTNMTGVAGQSVIGYTLDSNPTVTITGMTSNAPAAGLLITLENLTTRQVYQVSPLPPTSLMGDVQRTTERYFRIFPPIYVQEDSKLKLTVTNSSTAPVTQLITWAMMGVVAAPVSREKDLATQVLDDYMEKRISAAVMGAPGDMIPMQPMILAMDVPFTNTASEQVNNRRTGQFSRPVLIYGAQHNFAAKDVIAIGGPTAQFQTNDARYVWSLEQQMIWSFADGPTEPESWIMYPRPILIYPNGQIQGNFTNGTGGGVVGTGTFQVYFYGIQF